MKGYSKMLGQEMPSDAKFYFAAVGVNQTGVVVMSAGCAMPRTVEVVSSAQVAALMRGYGVTPEDIIERAAGSPA